MLEVFVFKLGECYIIGKYFFLIRMRVSISYTSNSAFGPFHHDVESFFLLAAKITTPSVKSGCSDRPNQNAEKLITSDSKIQPCHRNKCCLMIPHTLVCEEETVERTENIKNTFIFLPFFLKHQHRQIVFFSNFVNVKVFHIIFFVSL